MTRYILPPAKDSAMSFKTFAAEALADYKTTGAVAPSSRYLARAMLRPLDLRPGCIVAEFGAGTGVMTRALLDILPPDGTLFAFEINNRFYDFLKQKFCDKRLVLLKTGAEHLRSELHRRGHDHVDAVVSSLALGFFSDRERRALLESFLPLMDENSVYTQYQYIQGLELKQGRFRRFSIQPLLRQYFHSVQSKTVWRNIPPAFVFACRIKGNQAARDPSKPRAGAGN
jgi:phosphatidylethanolamine/phosphatidyl-N-methylethanolamine N-methyltransferase